MLNFTMTRSRFLLGRLPVRLMLVGALCAPGLAWATDSSGDDAPRGGDSASLEATVTRLIQQLGAEEYARRERAQAELKRLGLVAFEALLRAQQSEDIEIALRSRYLLQTISVPWVHEDDPREVKAIMRGYDGKPPGQRQALMEQLAALQDSQGVAALCRVVRFDMSDLLSKRAALFVMRKPSELDARARARLAETIARETAWSKRPGAEWLRAYVKSLNNAQASLADWAEIVRREEHLFHLAPENTSPKILRDLLRWQADLLIGLDRPDEAQPIMRKLVELVDGSEQQLVEAVDWLMEREAWSMVEEMGQRFADTFNASAVLLYRLAEAHAKQGHPAEAEQTANRALATNRENQPQHVVIGFTLQQRGLFPWAEREYRQVMEIGPLGSLYDLEARFFLSEMLHDLERELPAAEVLHELVEVMEKDRNILGTMARRGQQPGEVRSRMHYFFAEHFRRQGDVQKQREHLEQGVKADPTDADVLIAMYRIENADEDWREMTRKHIQHAVEVFRDRIRRTEQRVANADDEQERELYKARLASANNQLAWLVANTEGDFDEALRCSLRSLELRPNRAGYLDTLGRCYYAQGDFENAVKYQSQAAALEPYSGQIRRQLQLFERALEESRR